MEKKRDRNKSRWDGVNDGAKYEKPYQYTITTRTDFETVRRLTPAQLLEIREAANIAQSFMIVQYMNAYLNAAELLGHATETDITAQ